jgi:mannose-6-phosphate isomerase-like protein (cupin superfamily)
MTFLQESAGEDTVSADKVNLAEKLGKFSIHWDPKIVGALNGQHVKLVKFKGSFVWHHHEREDELFFVVKGEFVMHFRDRSVTLQHGEFIIVPHGIEHRPEAEHEVHVLLFEPAATVNTGSAPGSMTVEAPEWI